MSWWTVYDLFMLTRPMLMLAGWVFMFMGYYWGAHLPVFGVSLPRDPGFWWGFASYSLEMGAVYILNQIRDVDSDRANNKILILPTGKVSIRGAFWWMAVVWVASGLLALPAGWAFFAVWAVSGVFGFLYSGPLNLKGKAIPNIILNMLGYGAVAFIAGWVLAGPFSLDALWHCLPYIFGTGAVTAGTIIPDIPGDIAAGEHTIGTRYGARFTAWFALVCDSLAAILGGLALDPIIAAAGVLAWPFFAVSAFKLNDFTVKFSYRVASFILALLVGLRFPAFAVAAIAVFYLTKAYYRFRFGIRDYPSFTGR